MISDPYDWSITLKKKTFEFTKNYMQPRTPMWSVFILINSQKCIHQCLLKGNDYEEQLINYHLMS